MATVRQPVKVPLDWAEVREVQVRLDALEVGERFVLVLFPFPEGHPFHGDGGAYIAGKVKAQYTGSVMVEIGKPQEKTIRKRNGMEIQIKMTHTETVPWARSTTVVPLEDWQWIIAAAS